MLKCSQFSERLAQFVADGEPQLSAQDPLLRHLAFCSACREEATRLRYIEAVLRAYPRRAVDPALTERILAAIAQDARSVAGARAADVRLLTWELWVPVVTLLLALSIVALSIPEQTVATLAPLHLDLDLLRQPIALPVILPGLRVQGGDTLFWALWSALFAVVAGIGLWVSLSAWNAQSAHVIDHLEGQLSGLVQKLTGRMRQA